ncbi:MAG: DUF3489 domain-containing protein [Hyphomicrobiales bacterium]|jgi:hypothetical protein
MTQLDMIADTIAKLEVSVEDAKELLAEPAAPTNQKATQKRSTSAPTNIGTRPKRTPSKAPRSKKAILLALVERKSGASMQAMMDATGWQAHSVRAGLTGLRKAGVDLERRINRKGASVYAAAQIAAPQ